MLLKLPEQICWQHMKGEKRGSMISGTWEACKVNKAGSGCRWRAFVYVYALLYIDITTMRARMMPRIHLWICWYSGDAIGIAPACGKASGQVSGRAVAHQ